MCFNKGTISRNAGVAEGPPARWLAAPTFPLDVRGANAVALGTRRVRNAQRFGPV